MNTLSLTLRFAHQRLSRGGIPGHRHIKLIVPVPVAENAPDFQPPGIAQVEETLRRITVKPQLSHIPCQLCSSRSTTAGPLLVTNARAFRPFMFQTPATVIWPVIFISSAGIIRNPQAALPCIRHLAGPGLQLHHEYPYIIRMLLIILHVQTSPAAHKADQARPPATTSRGSPSADTAVRLGSPDIQPSLPTHWFPLLYAPSS